MEIERYDIRTSSRRVFRRCFRKWGYQSSMRMGLERRGAETNINFWFGTAIHFAMEDYFGYNKFGDPRRAFKAYYASFKEEDLPEAAPAHYELGLAMLTYFLEWYPKHNADMQFKTIWFNDKDEMVPENTPGARPAVEEEFLFDLGYKVLVNIDTNKMIKEWDPLTDRLYDTSTPILDGREIPLTRVDIQIRESDTVYHLIHVNEPHPDFGYQLGESVFDMQRVKIVPICYHGTMDKLVVDRFGRWWILDYKTAKGADTAKLETDDQISSYMWAAEQRFQHKFHGFIYLQLTKDVAKPPKVLKDGSLSTDKKQKTTHALYKAELLKRFGEVKKAPNKYIEMLNNLAMMEEPEGDRFIRWDFVTRNDEQKLATYKNILAETKMMLDTSLHLFPNPTRDCGWDCPFREACIATDQGRFTDAEDFIHNGFQRRGDTLEHNDDDWKKNIKWPDTPMEAAAIDDVDLRPVNIFNIELPDSYYSNDTYED
jgi:hypothetical protein